MRNFFVVIQVLFLLVATSTYAQDPHFSQFYASPLTLNPAFTGKFDGQLRVAGNYRNQWPSIPNAYITGSLSVDFGILKNKLPQGDVFGIGFSALSDKSGDGALSMNYGSVSLAYHKALDEDGYNTIGAGFQATYSSLSVNTANLKFEDQLGEDGFTNPTNDPFIRQNYGTSENYFDMDAGVLFSGSSDGENNYYLGLSAYHLNKPVVGFMDKNWLLLPRVTVHGGGSFPINDQLSIDASAIDQIQNQASETVIGAALCANANNDQDDPTNVYIGSWYRVGDAIIPYVGLEFSGIRIGATYDINVSSLKAATDEEGGAEISLIYIKKDYAYKGVPCPKF
jgi:type IX secretion system PorP/SprF family membrane protein